MWMVNDQSRQKSARDRDGSEPSVRLIINQATNVNRWIMKVGREFFE
jgi:hypothetical protein